MSNGLIDWSSSYINQEWIEKAQIRRVDDERGREITGRVNHSASQKYHGIEIPYIKPGSDSWVFSRLRRDIPEFEVKADGSKKELGKYLSSPCSGNSLYFPPETNPEWLQDADTQVIIVEGEKKAIALRRFFYEEGVNVLIIALPGVWNFTNRETLRDSLGHTWAFIKVVLPEIEKIQWSGRAVKILFDANALTNASVFAARRDLASKLIERGASVRLVDLEPEQGINGLDDYLGKFGPTRFRKFLEEAPGTPARMSVEDAKQVVSSLSLEVIKENPKITGSERVLGALTVISGQAPEEWFGVQATLRKVGQLAAVNKQIRERSGVGQKSPKLRVVKTDEVGKKPTIDFDLVSDLPKLTIMAWNALKRRNTGPHLFLRSGVPVRLEKDADGRAVLAELTSDRMRYEVAEAADWQEDGEDAMPPMEVVKNMLAMPDAPLPTLRRIVSVPVFAADGRLIDAPGFDRESGIYYLPAADFEAVPIPETITVEVINEANRLLCSELLIDFPFATTADRDNAVALAVLGAVREMIPGSTPNHAVEASIRSAGKGKLARACAGIFAGDELASVPPLETEKEWKDMITSELLSGSPAVLIDNIEKPLRSAALAVAWTEPFWKDRLFHKQVMARVPINCVWITTANNMLMHEDLMTRSIRIRLEPATSRPENRTGLKDLDLWCRENRANLVWAVHVIVKWWIQRGKPAPEGLQSTRHSEWCRVMGGILHCAGFGEFMKNQGDFQRSSASGAEVFGAFCESWWFWAHIEPNVDTQTARINRATTSDLLALAKNIDDFPISDREAGQTKSMGFWLKGCRGRRIESREEVGGRSVLRTYVIERHLKYVQGKQPWSIALKDEIDLGESEG